MLSTSGVTGGKSTIRRIEPLAGGPTAMVRSARSIRKPTFAGVSSVTHSRVLTKPAPSRTFTLGAGPSLSIIALPLSSCPVTTRRVALLIILILLLRESRKSFDGAGKLDDGFPALVFVAHEGGGLVRRQRRHGFHERVAQHAGEPRRGLKLRHLRGDAVHHRFRHAVRSGQQDPARPVEA